MLSYPPYRPTEKFGDLFVRASEAMAQGPVPVQTWERSSSNVTSRTQCRRTSMFQRLRIQPASSAGVACFGGQAGDRVGLVGVRVAEVFASRGVLGVRIHPQRSEVFRGDGMTAATRSFALSLTARRGPVGFPGSKCLDERPMKQ